MEKIKPTRKGQSPNQQIFWEPDLTMTMEQIETYHRVELGPGKSLEEVLASKPDGAVSGRWIFSDDKMWLDWLEDGTEFAPVPPGNLDPAGCVFPESEIVFCVG